MGEIVAASVAKQKCIFLYFYIGSICLYAYSSANILWLERLPVTAVSLLTIVVSSIQISRVRYSITPKQFVLCTIWGLYFFLFFLIWNWGQKFFYLTTTASFMGATSVILLPYEEKKLLLKCISVFFVCLIVFSVPAWLLFLLGVDLPHSGVIYHSNGFHEYYDFYFFRLSAKNDNVFDMILPRFSSVFLEPGQLATPCVFLFYLNGAKFCKKTIPFLLTILLSFSLVAVVLLFFCFLANRIINHSKHLFLQLSIIVVLVVGSLSCFYFFAEKDNPVNLYITSRLEYDENKGFTGNNRTSDVFERKYKAFLETPQKYLGIRQELKEGNDWTYNCSGYKKFIINHGIIGFSLVLLLNFLLLLYNWRKESIFFFIILVTAFLVRDLLQSPLWLYIAILGFSMLGKLRKDDLFRR